MRGRPCCIVRACKVPCTGSSSFSVSCVDRILRPSCWRYWGRLARTHGGCVTHERSYAAWHRIGGSGPLHPACVVSKTCALAGAISLGRHACGLGLADRRDRPRAVNCRTDLAYHAVRDATLRDSRPQTPNNQHSPSDRTGSNSQPPHDSQLTTRGTGKANHWPQRRNYLPLKEARLAQLASCPYALQHRRAYHESHCHLSLPICYTQAANQRR